MKPYLKIEWTHGRPRTGAEDDEARALAAAKAVFARENVDPADAFEAYESQWAEFDDEGPMTGLALIWIEARDKADIAATEGWHDPNGAGVTLTM